MPEPEKRPSQPENSFLGWLCEGLGLLVFYGVVFAAFYVAIHFVLKYW